MVLCEAVHTPSDVDSPISTEGHRETWPIRSMAPLLLTPMAGELPRLPASAVPRAVLLMLPLAGTGARRINRARRPFTAGLRTRTTCWASHGCWPRCGSYPLELANTRRIRGRHSWVSRRSKQAIGFPGTMGAEFIDYVIADKTVAPFDRRFIRRTSFTCRSLSGQRPKRTTLSHGHSGVCRLQATIICSEHPGRRMRQLFKGAD